jgi:RNA polymerase sigma-70 factor (ECF subfamily)
MKTPSSLLERLRQTSDQGAWERLIQLYSPLICYWARRTGLQDQDVADLTQDVFTLLIRKLPEFADDRHKSFRGWLRTVTLNRWRENCRRKTLPLARGEANLEEIAAPRGDDAFWEVEYRQYLTSQALKLIQREFQHTTWKACWEQVVRGRPAAKVADALGITLSAAYAAKSRVLRRLRRELDGLLE